MNLLNPNNANMHNNNYDDSGTAEDDAPRGAIRKALSADVAGLRPTDQYPSEMTLSSTAHFLTEQASAGDTPMMLHTQPTEDSENSDSSDEKYNQSQNNSSIRQHSAITRASTTISEVMHHTSNTTPNTNYNSNNNSNEHSYNNDNNNNNNNNNSSNNNNNNNNNSKHRISTSQSRRSRSPLHKIKEKQSKRKNKRKQKKREKSKSKSKSKSRSKSPSNSHERIPAAVRRQKSENNSLTLNVSKQLKRAQSKT